MKFDKILKHLLAGDLIRCVDWEDDRYIKVEQSSITVDEKGYPFSFSRHDYQADWEVYSTKNKTNEAGTLLSYIDSENNKKICLVVSDGDDYSIVNISDCALYATQISKQDFDTALDIFNLKREKTE